jgi:hypothetical protein
MAEGIKDFPNKVEKCTTDSETIKLEKVIDKEMLTKPGISFYCSKRHTLMFIENTKHQGNKSKKKHGKIHNDVSGQSTSINVE